MLTAARRDGWLKAFSNTLAELPFDRGALQHCSGVARRSIMIFNAANTQSDSTWAALQMLLW